MDRTKKTREEYLAQLSRIRELHVVLCVRAIDGIGDRKRRYAELRRLDSRYLSLRCGMIGRRYIGVDD